MLMLMPIAIDPVDVTVHVRQTIPVSAYEIVAVSRYPAPSLRHPRIGAFPDTLAQVTDRGPAWSLLADLARLGPNWDAYGAEPIDAACVRNVSTILVALSGRIPSPEITPNPNGTLTLDWETEDQALSLELGVKRFSSFWESRRGTKTKEGTLNTGIPDFVALALDSLFPEPARTQPLIEGFMIDAQGPSGLLTAYCYG